MKKTLLVTMDFPPLLGGIANYYYYLVKQMPIEKIVVLMEHTNKFANSANKFASNVSFRIYYKSFLTQLPIWPRWLPLIWYIYKIVKLEKVEIIWVGQILPVGTAVYIVSKILAVPYYVSCHGNDLLRAKSVKRKYKLAKKILKSAEYVTANTEFTKNILINDFDVLENKIKIIYPQNSLSRNQVDKIKVKELKKKYNLEGKKVLLTVARLVRSKGIDQVIKALPKVWQKIPDLVYLIVGDGPDRERLKLFYKDAVRNFSAGQIIFTGSVLHNELPNYYSLSDVFILTPRKSFIDTESFGIVYLEAKEFGLPIIAGDVGGVKEIQNLFHLEGENLTTDNKKFALINSESLEEIENKIVDFFNIF